MIPRDASESTIKEIILANYAKACDKYQHKAANANITPGLHLIFMELRKNLVDYTISELEQIFLFVPI